MTESESPFAQPARTISQLPPSGTPLPDDVRYVGFWMRALASLIDTVLIIIALSPVAFFWAGLGESYMQSALNTVLSAAAVIAFWVYRSATPGKMVINAVIVDAETLGKPTKGQWIIRYLGYYVSAIFLCLGFLWVAFDARKQGWHDKMAGTVVIKKR